MPFSTLNTLDDLEHDGRAVSEFGEDALTRRVSQALNLYNQAMQEVIEAFAMNTSQYQLPYGVSGALTMQPLDQQGSPDTQKLEAGGALGLPLRHYGAAVQWNRHFLINASVSIIARHIDSMASADRQRIRNEIMRRLMNPLNTPNYHDILDTKMVYDVKAPLNGDGMPIPPGPHGEVFDPNTHTHFLAQDGLTEAGLRATIDHVLEHGVSGGVRVWINRAQEDDVRAFDGFDRYIDSRIVPSANDQFASGSLQVTNPTDRAIGLFSGAEVWVKPGVPNDYQIVFDDGASGEDKPLAIRTRSGSLSGDAYSGGFGNLFEDEDHPLRATAFGREFGVGTNQRHKVAVNYSGGSTYVVPDIP